MTGKTLLTFTLLLFSNVVLLNCKSSGNQSSVDRIVAIDETDRRIDARFVFYLSGGVVNCDIQELLGKANNVGPIPMMNFDDLVNSGQFPKVAQAIEDSKENTVYYWLTDRDVGVHGNGSNWGNGLEEEEETSVIALAIVCLKKAKKYGISRDPEIQDIFQERSTSQPLHL